MKTINKQANENAIKYCLNEICPECGSRNKCDRKVIGECLPTSEIVDAFVVGNEIGVGFAQRWIPIEEELPPIDKCNVTVTVLVKLHNGYITTAFYDYDICIWSIIHPLSRIRTQKVIKWRLIELK